MLTSDAAGTGTTARSAPATATAAAHPPGHVTPIASYLKVYAALLVLTGVTVGVSLLELGAGAIYVALAVAVVKGTLVALYFMHLRHDTGFVRLVFVASLLFLVIFFVLTMLDLSSRSDLLEEQDTLYKRQEDQAAVAAQQGARSAAPARGAGP